MRPVSLITVRVALLVLAVTYMRDGANVSRGFGVALPS